MRGNTASPAAKTSDEEILTLYQRVGTAFHVVAEERGERLNAGIKNNIALYFYQAFEALTLEFFEEHLRYELNRYRQSGLRETYEREIYPLELPGLPPVFAKRFDDKRSRRPHRLVVKRFLSSQAEFC
ncbi:hypothetical protein [Burkholderia stabilis]|uniref:Uncharacterized protein n=1 Tax=Burkholderia stabilis TaxID=95485 RepID=A0A1Y1BSC5_9BURK|nr:hypothetical protein [Burkholderia stabilis]BAX62880.1 hypothetical protein BSFP_057480 [Burkholderia stabilis]